MLCLFDYQPFLFCLYIYIVAENNISGEVENYEAQARHWLDRMLTLADGYAYKGLDQRVLNEVLGPVVDENVTSHQQHASAARSSTVPSSNELVSHDSYTCGNFPESRPWPSRRRGREFVGTPSLLFPDVRLDEKCPWECRPGDHKDWLYC